MKKTVEGYQISIIESSDENRTELDINKKYFTDYKSKFYKEAKDKGRRALYYNGNPIDYQFLDDELYSKRVDNSIFEKEEFVNKNKLRTNKDKDFYKDGIYAHLSLSEAVTTINIFSVQNRFHHFWMKEEIKRLGLSIKNLPDKYKYLDYKSKGFVLSKRLLSGGISTLENSICNGSPFLIVDIDIKIDENPDLYSSNGIPNELNNEVFEYFKTISLLVARSSSGIGICAILYVPSLVGVNDNNRHKDMGVEIYKFINEKLKPPIKIQFDEYQARFSLGRTFPVQFSQLDNRFNWNMVELNLDALEFRIESVEIDKDDDVIVKRKENNKGDYIVPAGNYKEKHNQKYNESTLIKRYNREFLCLDMFMENGYEIAKDIDSKGIIRLQKSGKKNQSITLYSNNNRFTCHTSSLQGCSPFDILEQLKFNEDAKAAYKHVKELYENENKSDRIVENSCGYKLILSDEIDASQFDYENWEYDPFYVDPLESLRPYDIGELNEIRNSDSKFQMFRLNDKGTLIPYDVSTFDLLGITERDIQLSLHNEVKIKGFEYPIFELLKDKSISSTIKIKEYITKEIILEYCTSYITYIVAGCGLGKTTVFLGKYFPMIDGLAKSMSIIFIVPRIAMVLQQANTCNSNNNIIASTGEAEIPVNSDLEYIPSIGTNSQKLKDKDGKLKSVITTYDQFVNIPNNIVNEYNYVVCDESHQLASDLSYKKVISDTFLKIEQLRDMNAKVKFILLSATPSSEVVTLNSYFKGDFKLLNIEKQHKQYPLIYVHDFLSHDRDKKDVQIFNQILKNIDEGKKVIVFCENKQKFRTNWIKLENYCNQIGVESPNRSSISSETKEFSSYKDLVNKEAITVDLLYTTSVLNVGLNIIEGVDKGLSIIFDYSTFEGHYSSNGQIQLSFRNRNRNSEIHCFANLTEKDDRSLFKVEEPAMKYDNILYSFNNMKSLKIYEKTSLRNSIEYDNVKFKDVVDSSECATATASLEEKLLPQQKRLSAFIKLAIKHNCKIHYILNENENIETVKSVNDTNEFVINVLNQLLTIEIGQRIAFVNKSQSTSKLVEPNFKINIESLKINDDVRVFECEYHSVYHSLLQVVRRCYNTLSYYYRGTERLKTVLNFIINAEGRKTIDKKILDYIATYKCLHSENIIADIIDNIFSKEGSEFDKKTLEYLIEQKIPNDIFSYFIDNLSIDFMKSKHKNVSVINKNEFKNSFQKHISDRVKKTFFKIYDVKKEKAKLLLEKRFILNCGREIIKTEDEFDTNIFNFLGFDKKNETLENINFFDNILKVLSEKYPRETLRSHIIDDFMVIKDYFNSESVEKTSVSVEDFAVKYEKELSDFKKLLIGTRIKFCYAIINNKTDEVIIEKNMKLLYSKLNERGILNKMLSHQNYDYTSFNNFNKSKKLESCRNYTVIKKIPV